MDRYIKLEKNGGKVGEGTYGVVYKAKDKETGDFVALKVCHFFIIINNIKMKIIYFSINFTLEN